MGVWYSVFVRSFADSNQDGIGDLQGLISKLDYLQDLGISGIWLLPIHPAPSYHKYDVTDYLNIDPEYGTLKNFDLLISAAHERGISVMMDMVFNHVSSAHPWFHEAQKSKENPYRQWFVWASPTQFTENEQYEWHLPETGPQDECYYGLFWKGMPDLNFDHPPVREAIKKVAAFWINRGVDGFRLDAAMHIFPPGREKDNYLWWQELRQFTELLKPGFLLVGEITESCGYIAPYLKNGLTAAFNFELAEHIIQAILTGKQDCLADWLKGIHRYYFETDNESKDAIFLSNHDQIRTASRLKNDPGSLRLAASILLTLPGIPFLYYGEEIGMLGMKPDEYLREPFRWNSETNNATIPKWITPRDSTAQTITDLETQQADPTSVFHHYRNLLQLRNTLPTLQLGEISLVDCEEQTVIIFTRVYNGETLLILHNLLNEEAVINNEDEPKVHFEAVYASHSDCMATPHSFQLPGMASMILRVKN